MMEFKSENSIFYAIALILIILGFYAMLGFAGVRTILGIIIIMFLPFYLIFNNFNLSQNEMIIFSFFASITLFPSFVYWLGFVVPFRISIFIVFAALLVVAHLVKKFWKKNELLS